MSILKKFLSSSHPLLGHPGEWVVLGHGMFGEKLDKVPVEGRIQISHSKGKIVNEGTMSVVSATDPVTFQSRYELTPTEVPHILSFFQANEQLGDMNGQVVIFDDRIISFYRSGDSLVTGSEVLLKAGENRYIVTGGLYSQHAVVSLWKLDMVREAMKDEGIEKSPGQESAPPVSQSSTG